LAKEVDVNQISGGLREQEFGAALCDAVLTQVRRNWERPLLCAAGWWEMVNALGSPPSRLRPIPDQLDVPAPFARGGEHGLFA
jgi:hypothetical protein